MGKIDISLNWGYREEEILLKKKKEKKLANWCNALISLRWRTCTSEPIQHSSNQLEHKSDKSKIMQKFNHGNESSIENRGITLKFKRKTTLHELGIPLEVSCNVVTTS